MIITQNFIDMLQSEDCAMIRAEYYLNSNAYNPTTVVNNFNNTSISWIELHYIFDYDARLHLKFQDTRVASYNSLFIRTIWEQDGKEIVVPSFVIEDIHNINDLEDALYEEIPAWFIINLTKYGIRCRFNYSDKNFVSNQNAEIYNRHWHLTGSATDSYVIRDVSAIKDYSKNIKCLMSRGQKSSPLGLEP